MARAFCACFVGPRLGWLQQHVEAGVHRRRRVEAGILDAEKRGLFKSGGLFIYYYMRPGVLDELAGWLAPARGPSRECRKNG